MVLPATDDRCRVTLVFNIERVASRRPTVADDQVPACLLPPLDRQEFDAVSAARATRFQSMRNHDLGCRPEGGTRPNANA
jgi:hypothetical protein